MSSREAKQREILDLIDSYILQNKEPMISWTSLVQLVKQKNVFAERVEQNLFATIAQILASSSEVKSTTAKPLGERLVGRGRFLYPLKMVRLYNQWLAGLLQYVALFFYLIDEDPAADDIFHKYSLERWSFDISADSSAFTIDLKGRNVGGKATTCLPFKVTAHAPLPQGQPKLDLEERVHNWQLLQEIVKDTGYKKIYKIIFPSKLAPGEEFDIKIRCKWPGHFYVGDVYIFRLCKHLKAGLDRMESIVNSDAPITSYKVLKFDLREAVLKETEESCTIEKGSSLRFEKDLPSPHEVFIIRFSREAPSGRT